MNIGHARYAMHVVFLMLMGNAAYPPMLNAPGADVSLCADGKSVVEMAIAACTRLIESNPYDRDGRVAWLTNRGLHEQRGGRFSDALRDFDEAIQLTPENINLYLSRGATYGMSGELDKAIADFDHVLSLDPKSGIAYMNRATAENKKGNQAASLRDYDKAIGLVPENWIAWDGRCWVRAIIGKDLEGALADCKKALGMQPEAANTMNTYGLILYKQGRFEDAIASYDASIARDPGVASSYYMRGLARRKLNRNSSDDLAKALSMEPGIRERYSQYGIDPQGP